MGKDLELHPLIPLKYPSDTHTIIYREANHENDTHNSPYGFDGIRHGMQPNWIRRAVLRKTFQGIFGTRSVESR